jgi:hypothetical protein
MGLWGYGVMGLGFMGLGGRGKYARQASETIEFARHGSMQTHQHIMVASPVARITPRNTNVPTNSATNLVRSILYILYKI